MYRLLRDRMILPLLLAIVPSTLGAAEPERLSAALTVSDLHYHGINITGAERGFGAAIEESWGPAIPGTEGQTYFWPNPDTNTSVATVDTAFLPGGVNIIRFPFQWERLQPTLNADFDPTYLAKMKATAEALRKRGAAVLLDVHNYAYYKKLGRGTDQPGQHIGSAEVPVTAFADFWRRMAVEFGSPSKQHPFIFGIMNEPHDIDVSVWVDAAQKAVTAIRGTGAKNLIFVPGADWTTAADFSWSDNARLLQSVTDPDDNMAIEVHQYYDGTCTANGYVDKLKPFEDWAVANKRLGFLGELDEHSGDACHQAFVNLLAHLQAKSAGTAGGVWIGFTYWVLDASDSTSGQTLVSGVFNDIKSVLPATCANQKKDGTETDVDCGGECRRCADGKACADGLDCQSGFCSGGTCSGTPGPGGSGGSTSTGSGGAGGSGGNSGSGGKAGSGSGGHIATGAGGTAGTGAGGTIGGSGGTPSTAADTGCGCAVPPNGGTAAAWVTALLSLSALRRRRRSPGAQARPGRQRLDGGPAADAD